MTTEALASGSRREWGTLVGLGLYLWDLMLPLTVSELRQTAGHPAGARGLLVVGHPPPPHLAECSVGRTKETHGEETH